MQALPDHGGDRRRPRVAHDQGAIGLVRSLEATPSRRFGDPRTGTSLEATVELGERVARGATSVVHRGRHRELGVAVAVKVIDERLADDTGIVARLEREARILVGLRHEGIARVLDLSRLADGRRALVVEWLEGESLEQRLRRVGRLPLHESVEIAGDVTAALGVAHASGVLHRDVKPSNVMLVRDGVRVRAVLIDFGVARGPGDSTETATGGLLGTPAYMAPEQARDASRVGPSADIYGVGALLFRMLSGEAPYPADDPWATLLRLANEPPRSLEAEALALPHAVVSLVDTCLSRDPALRPSSATALGSALRELAELHAVAAPDSPGSPDSTGGVHAQALAARPSIVRVRTTLAAVSAALSLAVGACVATALPHPLRAESKVLVVLATLASLAACAALLVRERGRSGAVGECDRRLAARAHAGLGHAAIATAITTFASSALSGFEWIAVSRAWPILAGLVAFAVTAARPSRSTACARAPRADD